MNSPIIGITPSQGDGIIKMRTDYINAVLRFGGIPMFLPHTTDEDRIETYSKICDGLIFAGGADIDPAYYGESIMFESVKVTPERDAFELALFKAYFLTGKPIFGICRGAQLINVALGGTLYQHIDGHSQTDGRAIHTRNAEIMPNSRLASIIGSTAIQTNSFHHQAVKTAPPGVIVAARADDGTVEAIEYKAHGFLIAVQWHPEIYFEEDNTAAALFRAFIEACEK